MLGGRCRSGRGSAWPAVVLLGAGLIGPACAARKAAVAPGRWAGRNIELIVTAGGANAQLKCGEAANFNEPLLLDASSAFDVSGTYTTPALPRQVQRARLIGSVQGPSMTLALSVGGEPAGTFQLVLGDHATFDVCNS